MDFAMMKPTIQNVITMEMIAAERPFLLIIVVNVLVLVMIFTFGNFGGGNLPGDWDRLANYCRGR